MRVRKRYVRTAQVLTTPPHPTPCHPLRPSPYLPYAHRLLDKARSDPKTSLCTGAICCPINARSRIADVVFCQSWCFKSISGEGTYFSNSVPLGICFRLSCQHGFTEVVTPFQNAHQALFSDKFPFPGNASPNATTLSGSPLSPGPGINQPRAQTIKSTKRNPLGMGSI
ncbi:hypothetical protein CDAR_287021 [Caerostris darwini]|uniref:Uncharacterized protein n=1 Tax=Caerostris darwini TaxID=1538125 RepID=A0AAV4RGL0_9ARAC|nr:hypothetical protein CDAR_287021 [Caerostris darwini]